MTLAVHEPVDVHLPDGTVLAGDLAVPEDAAGIVAFAHGSGSSRLSPRNQLVAHELQGAGLATLLLDLLTPEEELADLRSREHRFDIALLAQRVVATVDWLGTEPRTAGRAVGLFGASTGAAAALVAAAARPQVIAAVVSRGGRPDLAGEQLAAVRAPTLLIVGGRDDVVVELNRQAAERIRSERRIAIVAGATHLFEEPGALDQVASLAAEWFLRHLRGSSA